MLKSLTLTSCSCCAFQSTCVCACKNSNSRVCSSRLFYSAVRPLVQLFDGSHTLFYCSPLFWRSALVDRNSTVTLLMFFQPTVFTLPLCALFKETVVFLKPLIYTLNGCFQWVFTARDLSFYWTVSGIFLLKKAVCISE